MDHRDFIRHKSEYSHFWYKAKKNLVENLMKFIAVDNSEDKDILDIGCGTGTILSVLKNFGQVTALDINSQALEFAKEKVSSTILADIENYDLEKDRYDIVCGFDILEHLSEDQRVIKNIYQSLKRGGHFVFTVPAYKFLFGSHDLALDHRRRYKKNEIKKKLKQAGFKIVKLNYWNFILLPLIVVFRIVKDRIFYKFFKKRKYNTDIKEVNKFLNQFLYYVLNLENFSVFKKFPLPWGLTIYGIVKK